MKLFTLASAPLKMSAWRFHSPPHLICTCTHSHTHTTQCRCVLLSFVSLHTSSCNLSVHIQVISGDRRRQTEVMGHRIGTTLENSLKQKWRREKVRCWANPSGWRKRSVELKLRISNQSWHLVDTVWNWGCVCMEHICLFLSLHSVESF